MVQTERKTGLLIMPPGEVCQPLIPFRELGMIRRDYEPEAVICRAGEPSDSLLVLEEGQAKIYRETRGGRRITYSRVQASWALTEGVSLGEYPVSAEALVPSRVVAIKREILPSIIQERPQFAVWLLAVNAWNISHLYDLGERLATQTIPVRCAWHLLDNAQEVRDITGIVHRIFSYRTQEQVAEEIGASRESVNKALGVLSDGGIVSVTRRTIEITDVERLGLIANQERSDGRI